MLICYPSWACPPLCGLVPGTSYLMAIKIEYFKPYLCCARLKNLFKNRIFVISVKNCTLQLNFKVHLPVTKIRLINTKSQIQARWHPFFLKIFLNITFNNYFRTVLTYFEKLTMQQRSLSPGASTGIIGFQNSATLFLAVKCG